MDTQKLLQLCEASKVLQQLEARGYIEREGMEVIFTDRAEKLLDTVTGEEIVVKTNSISEWIDEYRELFPKGISSGGYLVRGDKKSCIKKMQKFLQEYPEYDKDLILEATRNYITRKEMEGFKYMQLSHYFIFKDGSSSLAGECAQILETNLNSEMNQDGFEEEM